MDGMRYCSERELYFASDLKFSISYLNQIQEVKETKKNDTSFKIQKKSSEARFKHV